MTVKFAPTTGGTRTGTLTVTSNANNSPLTVALSGSGISSSTNIAAGQPASASSSNSPYVAANLTDADPSTYWESPNGAFPQWAQVDLGQSYSIGKVMLRLPPSTAWGARTETLSVLGSTDGTNFSTIVGSAGYTFDPNANNNTVTISFGATTARYVRVNITANTGWPAGQLSDFEVFPAAGGGTPSAVLSASPSSLTFPSQARRHHQRRAVGHGDQHRHRGRVPRQRRHHRRLRARATTAGPRSRPAPPARSASPSSRPRPAPAPAPSPSTATRPTARPRSP